MLEVVLAVTIFWGLLLFVLGVIIHVDRPGDAGHRTNGSEV